MRETETFHAINEFFRRKREKERLKRLRVRDRLALGEHCEQLLPGVPDQITLDHITSRLSWRDFHFLASVSRRWRTAIGSRQVYNARCFAKTTETLVLFYSYPQGRREVISVYSFSDRQCFELPPLPKVVRGVLRTGDGQWVTLDGRIYVLHRDKVYVLDVAGQQKRWKQCASMTKSRKRPECLVFNGKIYVFGGSYGAIRSNCHSEVYDPKEDTWSPIRQHAALVKGFYHVLPVGEELFVHYGPYPDPTLRKSLLVYHPSRDEWRQEAKAIGYCPIVYLEFVADGKLHSLSQFGVHVYDMENCEWLNLHSYSFSEVQPAKGSIAEVLAVVALDDELLAVVDWDIRWPKTGKSPYSILHSRGFRGRSEEIFWETVYRCSSRPSGLETIQV